MKILLTNDDGWGFEGLQTLEAIAREFGEVWTVAPLMPMSGISHQITFEVPMSFEEKAPNSFALDGTPADCIRVAMTQLDVEFDWVLSGINNGANLGSDLNVSGTVAAAREASHWGCKAIALSQHLKNFGGSFDWSKTQRMAKRCLRDLLEREPPHRSWFNVNFPDVEDEKVELAEIVETQSDENPFPAKYETMDDGRLLYCGVYKDRKRTPDRDIELCFNGHITVTSH